MKHRARRFQILASILIMLSIFNLSMMALSYNPPASFGTLTVYPGITFITTGYVNLTFQSPSTFDGYFNLTNRTLIMNNVQIQFTRSVVSAPNANVTFVSFSQDSFSNLKKFNFISHAPAGTVNFAASLASNAPFYGTYTIDGGDSVSTSSVHVMAFDTPPAITNHTIEIDITDYSTVTGGLPPLDLTFIGNMLILISFVAILTLGVVFAIRFRKWRGGGA